MKIQDQLLFKINKNKSIFQNNKNNKNNYNMNKNMNKKKYKDKNNVIIIHHQFIQKKIKV